MASHLTTLSLFIRNRVCFAGRKP